MLFRSVEHGTLTRSIDCDKLVHALKPVVHTHQSNAILLDIDMSDKLLAATFDNLVVITAIDGSDETVEATIFEEDKDLDADNNKSALRLVKEDRIGLQHGVTAPVTRSHVLSIPCRAPGAMEPYNIVPPAALKDDPTQSSEEYALVRPMQRMASSYFIAGP